MTPKALAEVQRMAKAISAYLGGRGPTIPDW